MYQAHPIVPAPSNLRRGDLPAPAEWYSTDPGYDMPGPIRRSDVSWRYVAECVVVFAAVVMFVILASIVYGEPPRRP